MPINQAGLNVTVKVPTTVTVGVPNRRTAATTNTQPVTLKASARTINQLKDIADVVETAPSDGHTLVYDSASDKYIVKQLTAGDINIASLDGGTF